MRPPAPFGPASATWRRWHESGRSRSWTASRAPSWSPRRRLGVAWLAQDGGVDPAVAGRRQAQLAEMDRNIARLEELLANPSFTARAPAPVVERERTRLDELRDQRSQLAREAG